MARSKAATKAYPKAPDGGYGWIIVFSSFMIHFLADGVTYTFGIFYVELLQHFKAGKGITAWVPSIMTGITYGIGPIASGLTNKYGCRTITIIGALFASFGLMTSAFAPNVTYLFFSIGICAGAGLGLIYLPAIVSVTCYFEKRRALATGMAVCGSGLGSAAFAPLTEWLIGLYGWRGGLLIISSLLLNCCVFGALLRPLEEKESDLEEEMVDNNNNVDSNNNSDHKSVKIDLNIKTIEKTINDDKNKPRNVIISKKISHENNDVDIKNAVNGDIMITKSCYNNNNNNDQSIVGTLSSLALESNYNNNNNTVFINSLPNSQTKEIPMLTISEPLSPSRHSICALYPPLADQLQSSMDSMGKKCEPLIVANNVLNGPVINHGNANNNGYQIKQNLRFTNNIKSNNIATGNQINSIQADEQVTTTTTTTDQPYIIQRRKNSASSSCGILYRRDIFYSASTMHLNLPTNTKSNQKLSYSASTSAVNDLSTSSIASESTTSPDVGTSGLPEAKKNKSNALQHSQIGEKSKYSMSRSSSLSLSSSSSSTSSSTTVTTASSLSSSSSSLTSNVSKFRWYFMSDWLTFLCSDEVRDTLDEMMNFRLLRNPIFLIFSISNLLTSLGFYVPHIYIKDRVVGRELASDSEASNLLAIMGIASTFGRLIFGFISDLKVINRLLLFNCCISLCGLSTILSSFVQTYTYMALYCAIFGVTCGAYVSLTSVILVDLLGIEKLTNAFGLVLLFQGVACLLGPPIVGWMFDLTGSYDPGFSWAGSMILIGGLILFLLPYITHGRFRLTLHNNKRKSPKIAVNDINLVVN